MTKRRRTFLLMIAALIGAAVLAWLEVGPKLKRPDVTPPALVPQEWAQVHDSPGHAQHVGKLQLACSTCHGESDGGFEKPRETACIGCHAKEAAHHHEGDALNPTSCTTCHQFKETPAPTCLGCHAQRQGQSAAVEVHVSSGAPCLSCHQPHGEKKVVQADCSNCHKDIKATHGQLQVSTDIANHEMPLAATEGMKGVHPANGTCADCHAPHSHAVAAIGSCQGCHTGAPQGPRPSDHAACVTCHAPHDLTVAAVKPCAGCHAEKRAALTANHAECKTCHTPHETENAAMACKTCHAAQKTLGAPTIAAHDACDNCHKPHEPKASFGNACVSCHSAIKPEHAPGGPDTCTTCHAMHPKKNEALPVALACTGCHDQAKSDITGHTKGLGCVSCHKPHAFDLAAPKTALCTTCHAAETKVAFASKGHRDCIQCHSDVHQPQREKTCATCHAAEASSAPAGHQACANCHQPHDGHVKPTATCQSCHAEEASSKHAHVAGGCATCHKPHGPSGPNGPPGTSKAPACSTCHAAAKLPGLHQLLGKTPTNGHQQCASCHSSHQAPKDDRATCTTCHEDHKNHQPQATECKGCHIFRAP